VGEEERAADSGQWTVNSGRAEKRRGHEFISTSGDGPVRTSHPRRDSSGFRAQSSSGSLLHRAFTWRAVAFFVVDIRRTFQVQTCFFFSPNNSVTAELSISYSSGKKNIPIFSLKYTKNTA